MDVTKTAARRQAVPLFLTRALTPRPLGRGRGRSRADRIVVGGGISGLASAHLHCRRRPNARILILDNHDDFGGQAQRNEFAINGTMRIGYGGNESIDTPSAYSGLARQVL